MELIEEEVRTATAVNRFGNYGNVRRQKKTHAARERLLGLIEKNSFNRPSSVLVIDSGTSYDEKAVKNDFDFFVPSNEGRDCAVFDVSSYGISAERILGPIQNLTPKNNRLETIVNSFIEEYGDHGHKLFDGLNLNRISDIIGKFCLIDFKNIESQITPNNSIIFDLFLENNREYSVELFLSPSEGNEKSVFLSAYKDGDYLYNALGDIDVLEKIYQS